jgi:hypothetical protein
VEEAVFRDDPHVIFAGGILRCDNPDRGALFTIEMGTGSLFSLLQA